MTINTFFSFFSTRRPPERRNMESASTLSALSGSKQTSSPQFLKTLDSSPTCLVPCRNRQSELWSRSLLDPFINLFKSIFFWLLFGSFAPSFPRKYFIEWGKNIYFYKHLRNLFRSAQRSAEETSRCWPKSCVVVIHHIHCSSRTVLGSNSFKISTEVCTSPLLLKGFWLYSHKTVVFCFVSVHLRSLSASSTWWRMRWRTERPSYWAKAGENTWLFPKIFSSLWHHNTMEDNWD